MSAETKPLKTSPPKINKAVSAKRVVTEVLIVLDKVSLTELFKTTSNKDLLFFLRFSLTLSKTTTVSFNEYPIMVKSAAIIAKLNSKLKTLNIPIVINTSCIKAAIAPIANCHSNLSQT